jgi:hypothetical protein
MKRLLLFLTLGAAAFADRPPDWLDIPADSDPRPSGASAWILEDSLVLRQVRDDLVLTRLRLAVMQLSEAGAKHAAIALPFTAGSSSVSSAKAWAMSPDGKKCREFGGADFMIYSPTVSNWIWDQSKIIYFNAQKYLQPGWIFAWEVEIKSDTSPFDFHWNPRGVLPVRHASLQLFPLEGGSVKWKAPREIPEPAAGPGGSQFWSLGSLPPFDVNVPPGLEYYGTELRAYMLDGSSQSRTWEDVVRLAREQMDPKAVATPAIGEIARHEVGTGGLWSRIEPVCRFVQKQVSYLEVMIDSDSMAGYRPHSAGEVCDNRYGDCKDKATLLCTMLRSVGVEAYVMLVNSGAPTANRMDWPSAFFNHAIVAIACREAPPQSSTTVRAGDQDYLLFDPTDDHVPFGLLPPADTGGLGLILAPGIKAAVMIPAHPADAVSVSARVRAVLADDGSAAFDVSEERFGVDASAAIFRDETISRPERTGALERRIQRRLPLIADLTWDNDDSGPGHSWSSRAHFTAQFVGKRMAGAMYVPTDLMSVVPFAAPWEADTGGWVSVNPGTLVREFEIDAPGSWRFSGVPEDRVFRSSAGEGSIHFEHDGAAVKGLMRLRINGGVLDRKAYLEYRDLLIAAMATERSPVVLARIKPAPSPAAAAAGPAH